MEFTELLEKRRSVRKYKDTPVPVEVLKNIINDSILAPSAGNEQSWKFIIINDRALLDRISDDCKKSILAHIEKNPNHYVVKYKNMLSNEAFNIFYNAPSAIFILGEEHVKNLQLNCTLAASYLMMSAASRGLGTCWVNFAKYITDPELLAEIGMPAGHSMVAPIIIGYPETIPPVPKRREPEILAIV